MSESPDATRKYIAPSPRPVIVSRTTVLMPGRSGRGWKGHVQVSDTSNDFVTAHPQRRASLERAGVPSFAPVRSGPAPVSDTCNGSATARSCDPEQRVHEVAVVEQLAGRAGVNDAARVENDDVLGDAAD